jgi:hypothetical protein
MYEVQFAGRSLSAVGMERESWNLVDRGFPATC